MPAIQIAPAKLPPSATSLTVDSIMTTGVRTVPPDTTLEEAIRLFSELDIRHMVVADADGRIAGVFSAGEALRQVTRGQDPATTAVTAIMRKEPLFVTPETSIKDSIDLLVFNRVHCLPVLREDRTVCGIVTTTNLLTSLYEFLEDLERPARAAVR